ncbi:MAG: flagellar protein FlaG [Treponema sp.]|nr:flagellar protein FlaG [Treponema sp.]
MSIDVISGEKSPDRASRPAPNKVRKQRPAAEAEPEATAPKKPEQEVLELQKHFDQLSIAFNKKLQFVVDHDSNDVIVKVIDPVTDKVIKTLPPKELQRLHDHIEKMIGLLFDEYV